MLELPKLPKELQEDNDILLWAKFISAERKEEFNMLAAKNTYIEKAYQQLQVISQDKQKRLEYEAREKAVRDYNQGILEAKEAGREEGMEAEKEATAQRLIALGLPTDIIVKGCGLSFEQIQFLKNQKGYE